MIGIIGKKLGMTQIFNEAGTADPLHGGRGAAEPGVKVLETRTRSGFAAVRARLWRAAHRARLEEGRADSRAVVARTRRRSVTRRRRGSTTAPAVLRSFRLDDAQRKENKTEIPTYNVGDMVKVEIFAPGDQVKVTGTSKGRGFQGVVKRYGFGGGPNTHGNTKHRRPGSIGPGTDPSRVIKGKKMPGHYGDERHTQTHLRIEKIDAERNLIYIRGAVAGPTNGIVLVEEAGLTKWLRQPIRLEGGRVHGAVARQRERRRASAASCSTARSTCR